MFAILLEISSELLAFKLRAKIALEILYSMLLSRGIASILRKEGSKIHYVQDSWPASQ